MASAPQPEGLPILYSNLTPLSSQEHGGWKVRRMESLALLKNVHAVPITVDEFAVAQRHFPIVFSSGPDPVPLALMGLNEGVNVFIGEDGMLLENVYLPAYVRRYPFMLARMRQDSDEMTLCFDPTPDLLGPFDEGEPLFDGSEPAQAIKDTLGFCEQFEMAAQRTAAFCKELLDLNMLEESEVTIQAPDSANPYIYRGFQMISEEKLRDLRGDQLRKMNQSGLLVLVHAHMFSLGQMNEIFGRQHAQGKIPPNSPTLG
jgi:hypothetical protein